MVKPRPHWEQTCFFLAAALAEDASELVDEREVVEDALDADGLGYDAHTCGLHGWRAREEEERKGMVVLDAVLMSSELDLLEIRLNELDEVVDRFFILESNATFTGIPKETYFADNRDRFKAFESKIEYHLCVPKPR